VTAVAISSDGGMFASSGADRNLRVWDSQTGEVIRTIRLQAGNILSICFSPTSGQLASGASDGMIRIWDPLQSERPVREFKHGPAVHQLRFSRDGKTLVTSGRAGAVRVWEAASGELRVALPSGAFAIKCLRLSPEGGLLAVATKDGRVRIWDIASETPLHSLETDPRIESLAFSHDGQQVVTGGYGGKLQLWSTETGELADTYMTFEGIVGDFEFIKNSSMLVSLGLSGRTMVIDTEARREINSIRTHNLVAGMIAQAANGKAVVVGSGDGTVKILDVGRLLEPSLFWHEAHIRDVRFLAGGRQLVTASGDGAVSVWDAATGKQVEVAAADDRESLAVGVQDTGQLVTSVGAGRVVSMRDANTKETIQQFEAVPRGLSSAVFSASGLRLAVGTRDGEVTVFRDADSAAPFFPDHKQFATNVREARIHALVFSQDESLVAAAYDDNQVLLFDALTGTPAHVPIELTSTPRSLIFCESDRVLAIGTQAGEIQLWQRRTQQIRATIKAHSSRVNALAVFPDGKTLASGGRDKELRLWDTESGELLTSLIGHGRQIFCIAISPDGRTIASGGLSGALRIWRSGR
jgi:WD40 repeat protein